MSAEKQRWLQDDVKSFKRSRVSREFGFSLIEVLITSMLMMIVGLITTSMMVSQSRELRSIDEKISLQDIRLILTNVLSSKTFCGCIMGQTTFNYTDKKWNSFPDSIHGSYNADCSTQGLAWLAIGSKVRNSNILLTEMSLDNVMETVSGSGRFTANLKIDFDQTILVRSRRSISVPFYFALDMSDPPESRNIMTCSSLAIFDSLDFVGLCAQLNGALDTTSDPPTCKPTYQ